MPAWLSYTICGPYTLAAGVNCRAPADVLPAIDIARNVTDEPVIVYPNSGEQWDGPHRTWIGTAGWSSDLAPQWVAAGARIVGGCCRVRPADVAELASPLLTLR